MARFFRSDAAEIAAEIMNDADSDNEDMYGEEEEEGDNFLGLLHYFSCH